MLYGLRGAVSEGFVMNDTNVLSRDDIRLAPGREPNSEPIPGYRLLEPLGRGGFGEVWKCEAPGGLTKAIKFVHGNLNALGGAAPAEGELRALQLVKAIRHPFLLSLERVEVINGELVIVTELADRSLQDVLDEHHKAGQAGISRDRLLGYLREAAEALDVMNLQHGLQHLDVKPGNLFLVGDHVKVADFGLVNARGSTGTGPSPSQSLGSITPVYASPEAFGGTISAHSDQYSLAVVYQQLLTQTLPFKGQNARQLLLQHTRAEPDLGGLPEADRPVVARALSKDPADRFATCSEFVRALVEAGGAAAADGGVQCVALPDYRFRECLGCSPLAEAWKVQAPDGRPRLVQFVYGFARYDGEWEAVLRYKALRHRSLRAVEVVQYEPGRLVLLGDLVEKNLHDRLKECRAQGGRGIPREELLGYLRVAAETLQQLHRQHGALHLGLTPRTLLLDGGRLVISDMGLAHLLWGPAGQLATALDARYAAPELFEGRSDPSADQYSLAVLFQELLTGVHPFPELPPGNPEARRAQMRPELAPLAEADRAVIARALDPDPQRRYSSCPEFVLALTAAGTQETVRRPAPRGVVRAAPAGPGVVGKPLDGDGCLRRRYKARLPFEVIRPRLDAFRLQWHGEVTTNEAGHLVFQVNLPRSFWNRWLGKQAGLEVDLRLTRNDAGAPTEVTVRVRAFGCGPGPGAQLVSDVGALLLESLRTYLQVNPERRIQERLIWPHPLVVHTAFADGRVGDAVEAQGKDISQSGIGFYLPDRPPTDRVRLELTPLGQGPVNLLASVARVQRCGESWFEVGALFVPDPGQEQTIQSLCAK
jgi:serine/threonine protein kinase